MSDCFKILNIPRNASLGEVCEAMKKYLNSRGGNIANHAKDPAAESFERLKNYYFLTKKPSDSFDSAQYPQSFSPSEINAPNPRPKLSDGSASSSSNEQSAPKNSGIGSSGHNANMQNAAVGGATQAQSAAGNVTSSNPYSARGPSTIRVGGRVYGQGGTRRQNILPALFLFSLAGLATLVIIYFVLGAFFTWIGTEKAITPEYNVNSTKVVTESNRSVQDDAATQKTEKKSTSRQASKYVEAAESFYQKGLDAEKRKQFAAAKENYELAAERGHQDAQIKLGILLSHPKDKSRPRYGEAGKWLSIAAADDNAEAKFYLANLIADGLYGGKKDEKRALELYKEAFDGGFKQAGTSLGERYLIGRIVPKNITLAKNYFAEASSTGDARAYYELAQIYELGLDGEQRFDLARSYYESAANLNHVKSQLKLADMFKYGIGTSPSCSMAFFWYQTAAAKGSAEAAYKIAQMTEDGCGAPKNPKRAHELYSKACKQGNKDACEKMKKK